MILSLLVDVALINVPRLVSVAQLVTTGTWQYHYLDGVWFIPDLLLPFNMPWVSKEMRNGKKETETCAALVLCFCVYAQGLSCQREEQKSTEK